MFHYKEDVFSGLRVHFFFFFLTEDSGAKSAGACVSSTQHSGHEKCLSKENTLKCG